MKGRGVSVRRHLGAAAALAIAAAMASAASARMGVEHGFDVTYRGFGPVRVSSDFRRAGPVSVRFEGCYAKGGPEAVCAFTVRAHDAVTVSNLRNLSHGSRVDGSPMRTCCIFRQGRPEGFPITSGPAEGVVDLAATLRPGEEAGFMLRLPEYRQGSPLRAITFSRGAGDPGITFTAKVRDLS